MFTTYANGRQTRTTTKTFPFDPTADCHTCAFRYAPGLVRFYADGKVVRTWKTGVPKGAMHLRANVWLPDWPDGKKPARDTYLGVDWVRYTSA